MIAAAGLAVMVASAWIGALACLRLATPLERLHAATFAAVPGGGGLLAASLAQDGLAGSSPKLALLWIALVAGGAVASQAMARAIHLRGGGRR